MVIYIVCIILVSWNSNLVNRKGGTLITPRHLVWARHYSIPVGTQFRFVDKEGNVYERTSVANQNVAPVPGDSSPFPGKDIVVGELDADLPSAISFANHVTWSK